MAKLGFALIALMFLAGPPGALAANHAKVSPRELALAINKADALLVPYRQGKVLASEIRGVRCIGPDEEPTEFQCTWQHRVKRGWVARKTWLSIDGGGWHVMDA
jgi:hypothetical protein